MKTPAGKLISLVSFYAVLSGCANNNPYTAHYSSLNGSTPESIEKFRAAPPPETPLVDNVSPEQGQERLGMWERKNYIAIGSSAFNSAQTIPAMLAVQQGKTVKADLVVIRSPEYSGSYATSTAVVKPATTITESSAMIVGANGQKNAVIKGNKTTYATTTDYVPTTEHRANYAAVYFIKQKSIFGARTADLTTQERQERQSNFGVKVTTIIDDSPAYNADILVGDILENMDGEKITNATHLSSMLEEKSGKTVQITYTRNGKAITKAIKLNKLL
ncbi:MAG: PDZ domain-containing protein [Gammaproteobacteria bacterium]